MKNKGIIQVGGKSYIRAKVVILATGKTNIEHKDFVRLKNDKTYMGIVTARSLNSIWLNNVITGFDADKWENVALYFLSEEEIKSENKILYKDTILTVSVNRGHYLSVYELTNIDIRTDMCKKIIATTDKLLFTEKNNGLVKDEYYLSRPSNEFLQAYCKANGKIDEVFIELVKSEFDGLEAYKLKVSPDNTITIKKVEEKIYSREEVEKIVIDSTKWAFNLGYDKKSCSPHKWIEENL